MANWTRREIMLNGLFGVPAMNMFLNERKSTGTLPAQLQIIRDLWKISEKARYPMTLTLPFWQQINLQPLFPIPVAEFSNTVIIPVLFVDSKAITLGWPEQMPQLLTAFPFIVGNHIKFNSPNIPEMLNFTGRALPFVECFRLEIPKIKIELDACEDDC